MAGAEKRTVAVTVKFTEADWGRVERKAAELWPHAKRSRAATVADLVMITVEHYKRPKGKPQP